MRSVMQIEKWFLEKRAIDDDNFPELPLEEEGGSNALPKQEDTQAKPKSGRSVAVTASTKRTANAPAPKTGGAVAAKGFELPQITQNGCTCLCEKKASSALP